MLTISKDMLNMMFKGSTGIYKLKSPFIWGLRYWKIWTPLFFHSLTLNQANKTKKSILANKSYGITHHTTLLPINWLLFLCWACRRRAGKLLRERALASTYIVYGISQNVLSCVLHNESRLISGVGTWKHYQKTKYFRHLRLCNTDSCHHRLGINF